MKNFKFDETPSCAKCGGATGMASYQFDISMMLVDLRAATQQAGLAIQLGGHVGLAGVMGPNPDVMIAAGLENPELMENVVLCQHCALSDMTVGELVALGQK